MEPDWANLESLCLSLILDKLLERVDQIWFGAACKNWRAIEKLNHQSQQFRTNHALPLLMFPSERCFNHISSHRVLPFQSHVPSEVSICGSSHGWVATCDTKYIITLFNPFKNVPPIRLPPLWNFSQRDWGRVTLSADPITSPNDYVVVAIYDLRCCIPYKRACLDVWGYVHTYSSPFSDAIFYKGLVYVAKRFNHIASFKYDGSGDPFREKEIVPNFSSLGKFDEIGTFSMKIYLVKSLEGDLWMVTRYFDEDVYANDKCTKGFHVYKLELDVQSGKLVQKLKLESLGDNVLFVGSCDSICLSASYFFSSLQKDSIYYCSDYNDQGRIPSRATSGPRDSGVYNVKNGSFDNNPSFKCLLPSAWVLPPFQCDGS